MTQPALPRVSVLLVDDRAENLHALEASLEPLGQHLVRAQSGDAALRAVLDEQFAVILMDVRMPGLDGFETIALLKQRERSRHTPIIFLTAYPEQQLGLQPYASGAVDYILKPFDPEVVRSKVLVFVQLRQNELALQAAHAQLEARVAERTAELAAANAALNREVAERTLAEQRLFDQAHHDSLTGLANRTLFTTYLTQAIARWRRRPSPTFAIMMLDVDRFKHVNDSLGHLAGDRLLLGIARRIEGCLREVDTAARLGGDELAILVEGITSETDATRLAERIQLAMSAPFELEGKAVVASLSIGIVIMSAHYDKGEDLVRDADAAMYRAKAAGRRRYQVFDVAMHDRVTSQLQIESELRRAVERDELVLEYQPIVELRSMRLVGFESLVRWRHPVHGLLGPADFIPLAEGTNLIRPIGLWVVEAACRTLAAWRTADLPRVRMSVNLSPQHLMHANTATELEAVITDSKIDPTQLQLEITESAMMLRGKTVETTLGRMHDLGVALCLDDFGIGHSCLSYLHELPISMLKLDRGFVQRVGTPEERPQLVRGIISLAHHLGIAVTAEGVETATQLARLRQLECEHVQGCYFAAPLDHAAATEILRAPPAW